MSFLHCGQVMSVMDINYTMETTGEYSKVKNDMKVQYLYDKVSVRGRVLEGDILIWSVFNGWMQWCKIFRIFVQQLSWFYGPKELKVAWNLIEKKTFFFALKYLGWDSPSSTITVLSFSRVYHWKVYHWKVSKRKLR